MPETAWGEAGFNWLQDVLCLIEGCSLAAFLLLAGGLGFLWRLFDLWNLLPISVERVESESGLFS